ncbi:hypothetical protein [Legionella maioricensis]|uniref:Cofactor-independent phosphoglycerate mutase n=1 Tax=Legionella maioricensis TaxID=2896528 RepID=A0A9X2D0Y2_9GAMM|nr:hypothetical protein [Legionella maioricensis]MCL9684284.1 hypothetical protein [Legionella maioricensis]MCL9687150.1 hypothetical protein [Legionella maioricensis]
MDVIINSACDFIPEHSKSLVSQGKPILNFLSCLGYGAADPPLADVLRRVHGLDGEWLILSPMNWMATHNDAMIVAADKDLQLDEGTLKYWFQLYSDYLAEEHIRLYYHDAETWLLHAINKPPIKAKPVHQLINHSLMPELAQLDSSMYWQKFFTEGQMFFASHPNKSLLNGVWLWGGAVLADKKKIPVCADEQFFSVAQICSENVTLYNPSVQLKQYSILLLSDVDILSKQHQEELKKMPVCWYWNNSAYALKDLNWLTRLWRNLTHAH